jgi:hypothetical protein
MRALNLGAVPSDYTRLEITEVDGGKVMVECVAGDVEKLYTVDLATGTLSPVPARPGKGS